MEGTDESENLKNEKETPPLQIDSKCFQDALKAFFQPIKTEDSRFDFYNMYKREATEYDTDYIKKYDEDLNTTLIFAGLFSAVSSAFVIDAHSNLQPDPNEQSAAILRAILLTLNQSAIPGETPTVPPVQQDPLSEIVTVTCLMYASLLISLLAAFVAMLGKQWLNRYLRNSGGSMIERCGDRQRKCDGLERWPLHLFIESLPMMLQAALFLLASGLCRHMWSINTSVAWVLISLTGLGAGFYVAIVIAGTSSYACPFQTPVSTALRNQWEKFTPIIHYKQVLPWARQVWDRKVQPLFHRESPLVIPLEDVEVQRPVSQLTLDSTPQPEPWLEQGDLDIIRRTNTNDVRCVSWILRNITDQEALDTAIRLAGEIRWFDDEANVDPPYDLIVSMSEACFDSNGDLHPGSRDRAYYSTRAMLWIRVLAMCKSAEFARAFPPPSTPRPLSSLDCGLLHLLWIDHEWADGSYIGSLSFVLPECTPSHLIWVSNLLLHLSWASRVGLDLKSYSSNLSENTAPPDATANRLLAFCNFLGSPVEEEVLKVQNRSSHMIRILHHLSTVIAPALNGTDTQRGVIRHVLSDLLKLENRSRFLMEMAYNWCSIICENHQSLGDWENLLLACLEIGFRHYNGHTWYVEYRVVHTEHHCKLVDVVFESQKSEAIADLLCVWTAGDSPPELEHASLLNICTGLTNIRNLIPFPPRLRRLVILFIELVGRKGLEAAGVEGFTELLNHLHVTFVDIRYSNGWAKLLLDTLQSPEGAQRLSHWYWQFLVQLLTFHLTRWWLEDKPVYNSRIMTQLIDAQEWDKLECWMKVVWMIWPPGVGVMMEEDLDRPMVLLFQQRPGAVQKLEQWMEQWSQRTREEISESFRRLCGQAHEAAQRDAPLASPTDEGIGEPARSPSSGGDKFWESLQYRVR